MFSMQSLFHPSKTPPKVYKQPFPAPSKCLTVKFLIILSRAQLIVKSSAVG